MNVFYSLGSLEQSEYEKRIRISDEYGSGEIRIVNISSLHIVYLSFILNEDLTIYYKLSEVGYKIILPIEGSVIAEKSKNILNKAVKDNVLISIQDSLEKTTPSLMCVRKGKKYKAISIYFNDRYLDNAYIKDFNKYWDKIIKNITDNRKQKYCSVDVNFEIKTLFLNLLPDKVIDIADVIAINSKVYEIIFKLKTLTNKDKLKLNQTEKIQVESLRQYLNDSVLNNSQEKISLDTLSKKFSINRDKMQKLFKKMYGETIFAFYRRIKLEQALIMLQEDNFVILDISKKIGYKNEKNFRIAFKNQYGILPSEVKKYK